MTWTLPINLATGDKVTDTIWNQQIIDNLIHLHTERYLWFADEKAAGTAGGGFTSGAWRTRDLTVEKADPANLGSLAANQITLAAGTYYTYFMGAAYIVNSHRMRLQNITAGTTLVLGINVREPGTGDGSNPGWGSGRFTLATSSVLELQHICQTTQAVNGFGLSAIGGITEVYASIEFWQIP